MHVTDQELAHRRSIGLDRWDEMWEGVLHMTPAPSLEHQRILGRLVAFLEPRLAVRGESVASHRDGRGASRARRDDREYREYLREEQRSPRGCIARRMQPDFHHGLRRSTARGTLLPGINVFRAAADYRIPDLTFVAAGREHVLSEEGVREGGPDAVIEIRSPEDETYEKLPFYAALGTREVVVVDRDTKRPEIYRLAGSQLVALQPEADGWLRAETMSVRFRVAEGRSALQIEDGIDAAAVVEI